MALELVLLVLGLSSGIDAGIPLSSSTPFRDEKDGSRLLRLEVLDVVVVASAGYI
jgi:hypothetical protein